jgi:hypothetical protein
MTMVIGFNAVVISLAGYFFGMDTSIPVLSLLKQQSLSWLNTLLLMQFMYELYQ